MLKNYHVCLITMPKMDSKMNTLFIMLSLNYKGNRFNAKFIFFEIHNG